LTSRPLHAIVVKYLANWFMTDENNLLARLDALQTLASADLPDTEGPILAELTQIMSDFAQEMSRDLKEMGF